MRNWRTFVTVIASGGMLITGVALAQTTAPKAQPGPGSPPSGTSSAPAKPGAPMPPPSSGSTPMPPGQATEPAKGANTTGMSKGMADGDVRAVQEALKAKGHDPGPIDGMMGPQTQAALNNFQKAENLQMTGRGDPQTLDKLGIKK
jgi:peptidoglycan hydrolase-like protein with peptidoglycan-binding domain